MTNLEKAKETIDRVFTNTDVSVVVTIQELGELKDLIQMYLDSLEEDNHL